jgi:hypothetical protein
VRRVENDTSLGGLDQERKVEAEVGGRARRPVNLNRQKGHQRLRSCIRDIHHNDIKNGRQMVRCLGSRKLVAVRNGSLAAVVGIRRRALAFLAAIRSFLIKPSAGEAVERPNQQKDCYEGDGDVHATAHSLIKDTRSWSSATCPRRPWQSRTLARWPVGSRQISELFHLSDSLRSPGPLGLVQATLMMTSAEQKRFVRGTVLPRCRQCAPLSRVDMRTVWRRQSKRP